jgi:glycosyltransferase involved in cell wall biosynthesis
MKFPTQVFRIAALMIATGIFAPQMFAGPGHRGGIDRVILPNHACRFYAANQEPPWHGVAIAPRPNLPRIHWHDKINPVWWFGNADDPVPPDWYEPGHPHRQRDWFFRNPLTNFSFFVIGVADKNFVRYGRYPTQVGNPHGGWNVAIIRRRILLLPFVDYKNSRMEFYFGWRERGNFGIKLVLHRRPEPLKK